ncbi:unnamed protein product [Cuscuta epithymum]|uniref:Uncharacterized protein n=1 Tax=Cuscuta epithymum TaxID=186058 RepID=A0AAV0GL58_9ASTE|nr:unnamed protein product [Cuscuta epithymum]
MPQMFQRIYHIVPAEESFTAHFLDLSVDLVNKHLCLGGAASLAPGQYAGGEYRRHSPRRRRQIPTRPIHQDNVPSDVVYVVREIIDGQFAVGEEQILYGPAILLRLFLRVLQQILKFADFGGELDIVRLDSGVFLLEFRHHVRALVDDHRPAAGVQRMPQNCLVGQPENQKIAGISAPPESRRDGAHLRGRHSGSHRRGIHGGVVQKRVDHRLG